MITPNEAVEEKQKECFRMITFDEVKDDGVFKGKVMQTILDLKFYVDFQLNGGKFIATRLCVDKRCDAKTISFTLIPDNIHITYVDSNKDLPGYTIMKSTYLNNPIKLCGLYYIYRKLWGLIIVTYLVIVI